MFFLSKALVELFMPFNLIILFVIFALVLLVFKKRKSGTFCLFFALFIVLITGYGFFTRDYLLHLESRYPALTENTIKEIPAKEIHYIVVLGSGHVSDRRLPVTSQIGGSSLYRLVEGIRLLHFFPAAKLVISGGIGNDPVPNADVVAQVAMRLGVKKGAIITENRPRDTMQEAQFLSPLLQDKTFILVTSASHMPRAMAIFRHRGLTPIPAPTDYTIKKHINKPPGGYLPTTQNLDIARKIIYEWIGTLWMKLKNSLAR